MSASAEGSDGNRQGESAIVADCLEWLAMNRIFAWRNNTGALKVEGRWIRYGHNGSGDILGVMRDGRFLSVECKTPAGRQSKAQKLFQAMIEKNGGVYLLVRSRADLADQIQNGQSVNSQLSQPAA